jgi:two-component system, OmpR family, sensor histidine kinase KdpD
VSRGRLRVYLGMAPGVGKTYAMLDEGNRRLGRGTDVVIGVVETHGRAHTAERLEGLEVVPRRRLSYRGATFEEMDLDAVLARRPNVALVDELAHTNVPGSRNEKRWQDVEELLDDGIDVVTTVNIQHLESLNDVVQRISGVEQRERIPDEVVRRADQIEIVDIAPEALRRRMAHGNIYPSERVDAALSNYFRIGNLSALRELALLWVAERVDEGLQRYRAAHGIEQPWEARERIVVALPGGPEGETLLRRAVRIATRTTGSDLLALHVVKGDGLSGLDPAEIGHQRRLAESMGGSWHQVVGDDVATAILDFARVENATQIVLGASSRGRFESFLAGEGIGARVTRLSGKIDVHLVTHEAARGPGLHPSLPVAGLTTALSARRRLQGAVLALVALPLLTFGLSQLRSGLNLPSDILLYLAVVILVALVGGMWPAIGAAILASLLLNYYFTPPLYTFTISDRNNAFALLFFIAVAALVSALVERVVRRTTEAGRAAAEAAVLAGLAGDVLRGATSLQQILGRARETFGLRSAALLERPDGDMEWSPVASVGDERTPGDDTTDLPVGEHHLLRVTGPVRAADARLLAAFAAQAAAAHEREELADRAAQAAVVAEADRTRSALLAAVSHDLRSPLASAKASITSLRSRRVQWTNAARDELLATADESLDRLTRLIENLLDMSRLEAGALGVSLAPVALDELVPLVLDALGVDASEEVRVKVPETLPEVRADAVLLERVLVNVLGNALRYSPPGNPPLLAASCHAGAMQIRVVDRGPGVPEGQNDQLFAPFQRLGDRDNSTGVGLGLALSRGLTDAMGGTLAAEDTPGGGLTMTITLPVVADAGEPLVQHGELPLGETGLPEQASVLHAGEEA